MTPAQVWTPIAILSLAHISVATLWWSIPHRVAGPLGPLVFAWFLIALAFGTYEHFLRAAPNNVLHLPPVAGAAAFRLSSVFLVLLELIGCALAFRFARASAKPNPTG
jgi:hypothetical protein